MDVALVGFLLFGSLWPLVYVFGLVISLCIVIPKVRRVGGQPVLPWVVACAAVPWVTALVVHSKVD